MGRLSGFLYVTAAVLFWGAYFPFAKILLRKISLAFFLTLRLGIGAAVLYALCAFLRRPLTFPRRDLFWIALGGIFGVLLHQLLQVEGIKYTSATNVGWILTLIPPVTGLMAWAFLKESISLRQVVGLTVAMTGLLFFISRGHVEGLSLIRNYGDLLCLLSVFTWSIYNIINKYALSRHDPMPLSALQMAMGFAFFFALGAQGFSAEVASLGTYEWGLVVAIGILPSGLAYHWWNAGLKRLPALDTNLFLFVEAIFASLTGHWVLGEEFTLAMSLYALVIFVGVYIAIGGRTSLPRSKG